MSINFILMDFLLPKLSALLQVVQDVLSTIIFGYQRLLLFPVSWVLYVLFQLVTPLIYIA